MKTVLLEHMRWPEVKKALEDGYKTVIIPAGSIEQHGPHLPECTDAYLGQYEAELLARKLGKTLVAPVIRPALSEHHMYFPGSLTLRPETFWMLLEDYISSYIRHGFKNIVLFPAHGGNFAAMEKMVEESKDKYPDVTVISCVSIPDMIEGALSGDADNDLEPGATGSHSGDGETSVMLAAFPELVDMSKAERGYVDGDYDKTSERIMSGGGMQAVTANGIIGDARKATAEKGKKSIEKSIAVMAKNVLSQIEL